jgi:hypothetical protein
MTLDELLQEKHTPSGTYAAVKFSQDTKDAIEKYIKDNDIPNGLAASKMHCTLLYSRKHCPDYEPLGKIDPPWIGKPTGLDVWESKGEQDGEEGTRCLVMEFKCDKLNERHEQLMDEHQATYDFPEYKTHVTLSYDIGDLDEAELPDIKSVVKKLEIVEEYGEDLDLSWAKNEGTEK